MWHCTDIMKCAVHFKNLIKHAFCAGHRNSNIYDDVSEPRMCNYLFIPLLTLYCNAFKFVYNVQSTLIIYALAKDYYYIVDIDKHWKYNLTRGIIDCNDSNDRLLTMHMSWLLMVKSHKSALFRTIGIEGKMSFVHVLNTMAWVGFSKAFVTEKDIYNYFAQAINVSLSLYIKYTLSESLLVICGITLNWEIFVQNHYGRYLHLNEL